MKKLIAALAMTFFMLMAADISNALAKPKPKADNPGLPGCLAKVNQLEQVIAEQYLTILGLQEQINDLQALLDAMKNYAPVPQTGQTESYYPGDDGYLEKGIDSPQPRFTDNANGTVTDNLTGLIWLKDPNRLGKWTWSGALDVCNGLGDDDVNLTDGSFSGDWRLPNIRELQSLIHYGFNDPALPNTNGTGKWSEGDPFIGVQCNVTYCGYYWSSTTATGSGDAFYMYLGGGFVGGLSKNHYGYFVWPVRDAK